MAKKRVALTRARPRHPTTPPELTAPTARRTGVQRAALGWHRRLDPHRRATQIVVDDEAQADGRARDAREHQAAAVPRGGHL